MKLQLTKTARAILLGVIGILVSACVTQDAVDRGDRIADSEIAAAAGCSADEVALCVETNCEPEKYQCAARSDVRSFFKADEFRHR